MRIFLSAKYYQLAYMSALLASALMEGLWDYDVYNLYETEQTLFMRIFLSAKYYQLAYMSAMLASALMNGLWNLNVWKWTNLLKMWTFLIAKYYQLAYNMSAMLASALMDGLWYRDVYSLYETVQILLRCEFSSVPSWDIWVLRTQFIKCLHYRV